MIIIYHSTKGSGMMHTIKMLHQVLHLKRYNWLPRIKRVPLQLGPTGKFRNFPRSNDNLEESLLEAELSDGKLPEHSLNSRQIPKGCLAVYVGPEHRRFVIPASYLSMPDFRILMEKAEEEFGFQHDGGLQIPCEEKDFQEVLVRCRMSKSKSKNHKKM